MNKKVLVLILVIFIVGCSDDEQAPVCNEPYILVGTGCCLDQNNNSICDPDEPPVVIEQNLSCPKSCDDANSCTNDACSAATNFTCFNEPITDCCGNGICEQNESYETCRIDCDLEVDLFNLQDRIIDHMELRNLVFTQNETRDYYIYTHNSIWATILEARTNDAKIRDFEDVRELAQRRTGRVLINLRNRADRIAAVKSLDYVYEVQSTITQVHGQNIVYDNYVFYYDIVSPEGKREFSFPEVYPVYTLRCNDDLAVEVYTDPTVPYQGLYSDGGKTDDNVERSINNYIKNQEESSRTLIRKIVDFCKG